MSDWESLFCFDNADVAELDYKIGSLVKLKQLFEVKGVVVRYGRITGGDEEKGFEICMIGDIPYDSQRKGWKKVKKAIVTLQKEKIQPIRQCGAYLYGGVVVRFNEESKCLCSESHCDCLMKWRGSAMVSTCKCIQSGIQCCKECVSCNRNAADDNIQWSWNNNAVYKKIPQLGLYETKMCGTGVYCMEENGIKRGELIAIVGGEFCFQKDEARKGKTKKNKKNQDIVIGDVWGETYKICESAELIRRVRPKSGRRRWYHKIRKDKGCVAYSM